MLERIEIKDIRDEDNIYQASNGSYVKMRTKIISEEADLNSSGIVTVLCCAGSIVDKKGKTKLRAGINEEDIEVARTLKNLSQKDSNPPEFYLVSEPQTLTMQRSNEEDYDPVKALNDFLEQIVEQVSRLEDQDKKTNDFLNKLLNGKKHEKTTQHDEVFP